MRDSTNVDGDRTASILEEAQRLSEAVQQFQNHIDALGPANCSPSTAKWIDFEKSFAAVYRVLDQLRSLPQVSRLDFAPIVWKLYRFARACGAVELPAEPVSCDAATAYHLLGLLREAIRREMNPDLDPKKRLRQEVAIGCMFTHPDWSVTDIARAIGVHDRQPYNTTTRVSRLAGCSSGICKG